MESPCSNQPPFTSHELSFATRELSAAKGLQLDAIQIRESRKQK